ncbi:hypothetical protein IE53DRAFT_173897 [Violaceomyces palustris]|uniref:Uncharacterized protein n=1 Tax=Violaceomyces palustris TaxID=1673888 RepID=A0ACD0NSU3_9BASI|nr:hypothetical protein IE53DRAFT_173897 [Violaceomyces palustris]
MTFPHLPDSPMTFYSQQSIGWRASQQNLPDLTISHSADVSMTTDGEDERTVLERILVPSNSTSEVISRNLKEGFPRTPPSLGPTAARSDVCLDRHQEKNRRPPLLRIDASGVRFKDKLGQDPELTALSPLMAMAAQGEGERPWALAQPHDSLEVNRSFTPRPLIASIVSSSSSAAVTAVQDRSPLGHHDRHERHAEDDSSNHPRRPWSSSEVFASQGMVMDPSSSFSPSSPSFSHSSSPSAPSSSHLPFPPQNHGCLGGGGHHHLLMTPKKNCKKRRSTLHADSQITAGGKSPAKSPASKTLYIDLKDHEEIPKTPVKVGQMVASSSAGRRRLPSAGERKATKR